MRANTDFSDDNIIYLVYFYVNMVTQMKTNITKKSLHVKVSSMAHISLGRERRGQEKRREEWGAGSPPPAEK